MRERILLSFVGNHDPFADGQAKLGPILSILGSKKFDRIILLFNNDKYWNSLTETQKYCNVHYPKMQVDYRMVDALNPIDYNIVYPAMYKVVAKIVQTYPEAKFTISLTSGTPTMHSCWILLKQGGVIDAELLQISRENGLQKVTFRLDDFPKIKVTKEIKVKLTQLARENELMKNSIDFENSLEYGFYIPEEGVDIDNEIIPAYYKTALKRANNNATKAAELLKLKPHTFRKRLRNILDEM